MKMLQYTVKRFVIMLFTLFIIATATFFLLAATPGDALSARVEKLPDSVAARMYAKYGLDKPVMERYVITMKGLVHGDFGESIIYEGQTVQSIIKEKPPSRPGWASSRCCWAFPSAWHWACWQP